MTVDKADKVALLWREDRQTRGEATAQNINRVFEALTTLGICAEPAIYADDTADDVREQLLKLDGVLVWVDPIYDGQNRTQLDCYVAGRRLKRCVGQCSSRRDPQNGRQGSPLSDQAPGLGDGYPSVSQRPGVQ